MISKQKLHNIIFNNDTKEGRLFDIVLLCAILLNTFIVLIESVPYVNKNYYKLFHYSELFLTFIFTIEFFLRLWCVPKKKDYLFGFWGIIDFISIMPTYLSIFFPHTHYLIVIRILRLLRVFRVLKLTKFTRAANVLIVSLINSSYRIGVFFIVVLFIVTLMGAIMYVIEGPEGDFYSIPQSIYWAIVTITTVGFGDITPQTTLGKFIASFVMILGYAIIAIPTGIISGEFIKSKKIDYTTCTKCSSIQNKNNNFCSNCGSDLYKSQNEADED